MNGVAGDTRDFGSSEPSRSTATGGTRVARTAGIRPATTVTRTPTSRLTSTVRSAKTVPACGRSISTIFITALRNFAMSNPEGDTDRGCRQTDQERLEHDRAQDLAARRADRPQQRELPRPLRDGDRERVEDDERADEERDPGEGEQEDLDERDEALRGPRSRTGPPRSPSAPSWTSPRARRDSLRDRRGRHAGTTGDRDRVDLAALVEQRLGRAQVEGGDGCRAERVDVPVLDEPDDPELLHGPVPTTPTESPTRRCSCRPYRRRSPPRRAASPSARSRA